MSRPAPAPRQALLTGLSAGVLALGADTIAHAFVAVPFFPDQLGALLLRPLPLGVFSALPRTFGVLARPLLLVATTVIVLASYAGLALLVERLVPRLSSLALPAVVGLAAGAAAIAGAAPSESMTGLVIEILILALAVPAAGIRNYLRTFDPEGDPDRRRLLRNLFYGAMGIAALGIAVVELGRFVTALTMKEGSRPTSEVTPVADFYVVSKNLSGDPVLDVRSWRLEMPGRSLTYDELLALPAQRLELTLECISNEVGGMLISNGIWKGPRVADVLARASMPDNTMFLLIESADGYTESFPLADLSADHVLATHLNGQPLTPAHGFPARFIFPGRYGMKQPKWVTRLRFAPRDERGYWEQRGWDERAIVKTMSRIDSPLDGALVAAGRVRIAGIAFAGDRGVGAVELSWDRGAQWQPADLEPEFSRDAWRFWHLETALSSGRYEVVVRARDGAGALQPATRTPTLPDGASGWHRGTFDVK